MKRLIQKASDNPYFHPDFHIALNYGLEYLNKNFGEEAVREYLTQFAQNYSAPLKKALKEKGLQAIEAHYENIFKIETAAYKMEGGGDELVIRLAGSPAVMHIKSNGHKPVPNYHETVIAVNKELCRDTPFDCELQEYNHETGGYCLRFFMRKP